MVRGAAEEAGAAQRRTQAERTATAHRRMIRAAIRLIARQGYTRTTLAQVGKEAGYTGGLVSHHFGSKEGLARALVEHAAGRFYQDQLLVATRGKAGLDALCASMGTYLDELVVREELNREFRRSACTWIREGMEAEEIRSDLDPDAEAAVFVGMLRGVATQWMADPRCFDLDAVRESLKDALRRHLAAGGEGGDGR
jgi:AcrR family transcriptional regulator